MTRAKQPWWRYQVEVAEFFRELGLETSVDQRLAGARTTHDVDVVARFRRVGVDILWIIECKHWQTPVSKLHALALREIVADVGADRGIVMAERGFQRGAHEAAGSSNVLLTSLAALRVSAEKEISALEMRRLRERIDACHDRYWRLDKSDRIASGLRPDVGTPGFSSTQVIEAVRSVLDAAAWGEFPVRASGLISLVDPTLALEASTMRELITQVEPVIADLERRLAAAEGTHQSGAGPFA